ncbi:hypothetical protein [Parasitella parasitica]|uniref:Uncharacterized protein n=1 Tax=Parasitella parasitica TaxID=35722 RepID=A0A0B7N9U2_9FUNG|nr:hypothetical protein [Parasitella parasitica]
MTTTEAIKVDQDIADKIDNDSSTLDTSKAKSLQYCSLFLKLAGLLIIVGVVLLFALLPNYIQSRNTYNSYATGATDPTNAILPGGGGG